MFLFPGVTNDKPAPSMPTTDLKADGVHENGIVNAHQVDSTVSDISNEVKGDREVKQEVQSIHGNISHQTVAQKESTNGCPCELRKEGPAATIQPEQALFLVKNWRTQLCRCPNCLLMYEERGIGFLLDSDDTLQVCFVFHMCQSRH